MQALLAFGVTLVIVLLVAGWTWTTHGSLHGSVTLAGVCRDMAAGGVPSVTRCDEAPVSGAHVIVSAADVPIGSYEVGAWVLQWRGVGPSKVRGRLVTGGSAFRVVSVVARTDLRMDLSLAWYTTS